MDKHCLEVYKCAFGKKKITWRGVTNCYLMVIWNIHLLLAEGTTHWVDNLNTIDCRVNYSADIHLHF